MGFEWVSDSGVTQRENFEYQSLNEWNRRHGVKKNSTTHYPPIPQNDQTADESKLILPFQNRTYNSTAPAGGAPLPE